MSPGAAVALALLLDAALIAALLARSRPPIGVKRTLAVLAATLLLLVVQVLAVVVVSRRFFLALNVLHAGLFMALPLFGGLLALGRPWRATRAARATAAVGALVLGGVGIHSTLLEPEQLVTERQTVRLAPARAGRAALRVGVLADLQCDRITDHERRAVAELMAERPDLILLPGDLAQASGEQLQALVPELRALLADLQAPLGVFAVLGDTDEPALTAELLQGTGVRLLVDESVELVHDDRRVTLGGVSRHVTSPEGRRLLERLAAPGGDDLRLLLAHKPDWSLQLPPGGRIDLVVAGHTHGGQVQLPFVGPLITLSRIPRRMGGGGLFGLGGSPLYVSRGVGCERGDAPRLRFNCPPEISLLTLATDGIEVAGP